MNVHTAPYLLSNEHLMVRNYSFPTPKKLRFLTADDQFQNLAITRHLTSYNSCIGYDDHQCLFLTHVGFHCGFPDCNGCPIFLWFKLDPLKAYFHQRTRFNRVSKDYGIREADRYDMDNLFMNYISLYKGSSVSPAQSL